MTREEILEYPYDGVIKRIIEGHGDEDDTFVIVYQGKMDEHMVNDEIGNVLQTSTYIVSIPLTKDADGKWIVPRKGDIIEINVYGMEFSLTIDNCEPSQLGGVSIYATRNSW